MSIQKELEQMEKDLDLINVLDKCAHEHCWEKGITDSAKDWYIKHWYLCNKYPNEAISAISGSADELWHSHITDTQKYTADSNNILGVFMHHKPIYGEPNDTEIKAYERTKELYMQEFGALPSDMRMTSHRGLSYALPRV